jgi:hypothetical protein
MISHFISRILACWQAREAEFIERTIEDEIERAMADNPNLKRADLEASDWLIPIPDEQRQISSEVRARFAAALAPHSRTIMQPMLFDLKPRQHQMVKSDLPASGPAADLERQNPLRLPQSDRTQLHPRRISERTRDDSTK